VVASMAALTKRLEEAGKKLGHAPMGTICGRRPP